MIAQKMKTNKIFRIGVLAFAVALIKSVFPFKYTVVSSGALPRPGHYFLFTDYDLDHSLFIIDWDRSLLECLGVFAIVLFSGTIVSSLCYDKQSPNRAQRRRYGIALLVAAVLAGGIWTLSSFYEQYRRYSRFPVHSLPDWQLFQSTKHGRTQNDIVTIESAIDQFYAHYHRLPFASPDRISHERECAFSITIGHELNGVKPSLNPENSDGIVFWDIPVGEQLDGWGNNYHYFFDHNEDGVVSPAEIPVHRRAAIWSNGPNQRDEHGNGDDIRNW